MKFFYFSLLILVILPSISYQQGQIQLSKEVKCLVCRVVIREMEKRIAEVDSDRMMKLPGYNNEKEKMVRIVTSEIFLNDVMEDICEKLDGYGRARDKETQRLTLIKFVEDDKMNPDVGNVDFVQDSDLNQSLQHFCSEILEDNEEGFLNTFSVDRFPLFSEFRICHEVAQLCNAEMDGIYGTEESTIYLK